jgi:hypothetical protein
MAANDNRRGTFIVIPYPVQVQTNVPWAAKAIWATVDGFTRGGGQCWLSIPELAHRVGLKPRQTSEHIRTLLNLGWLDVGTRSGRKRGLVSTLDLDTCEIPQPLQETATIAVGRNDGGKTQPLQETATYPCDKPQHTHAVNRTPKQKSKPNDKPNPLEVPKKNGRPISVDEVAAYFAAVGSTEAEAMAFWDYWESAGWKRRGGAIKNWEAAARSWIRNTSKFNTHGKQDKPKLDAGRAIQWAQK